MPEEKSNHPNSKAWKHMEHQNPNHDISHKECDWVIENFIDTCRRFGSTDDITILEQYWADHNKNYGGYMLRDITQAGC